MTLTIELSPETEQQLTATASAHGQALQEYISALIARELAREAEEDAQDVATARRIMAASKPEERKTLDDLRRALGKPVKGAGAYVRSH